MENTVEITWYRSDADKSYDFTARDGEIKVGRIYRHFDGQRWQWFFQQIPGRSGIEDSRQEAIDALLQAYERWQAHNAKKAPPAGEG